MYAFVVLMYVFVVLRSLYQQRLETAVETAFGDQPPRIAQTDGHSSDDAPCLSRGFVIVEMVWAIPVVFT